MYGSAVTITPEGAIDMEREMTMTLFVVPCLPIFVMPAMSQGLVEQCYAALVTGMVGWVALRLFDYVSNNHNNPMEASK